MDVLASSNALDPLSAAPPLLLPAPRSMTLLPGRISLKSDPLGLVLRREDRSLPRQGYTLHIGVDAGGASSRIIVTAADDAGITHANATMQQLMSQYGTELPRLIIEDAPAFETRGVMLDVSRDRVPTNRSLRRAAMLAASLKLNHLQLYTEHTFAYRGHDEIWTGCSPITADEVRRLDELCRGIGVELGANQNTFGHLARWLRHPRYAPLAETHDEYDFYGVKRSGPFSLCPTDPGSLDLVASWLDQLLPCFSSRLVNINGDETADVGSGRSRSEVERRGSLAVYLEYLSAVARACVERGRRPMFWADVVLHHPERASDIPEELLALVWGYEPGSPFDAWCRALAEAGRRMWVCPGTSSWRSITGRTRERTGNLAAAAAAGLAHGALGYMVTDWGDLGHRQQQPIAELGIAHAAAVAWNPVNGWDARAASLHVLGDRSLRVGRWLEELGDVDVELRAIAGRRKDADQPAPLTNGSALFEHLHPCGHRTHLPQEPGAWSNVLARMLSLRAEFGRISGSVGPLVRDELWHTLDVAEFAARHALWQRSGRDRAVGRDLVERLEAIIADHRRLWLVRSRPGGLADSSAWYERLRGGLSTQSTEGTQRK